MRIVGQDRTAAFRSPRSEHPVVAVPRRALADSHSRPVGSGLLEPRATGYVMFDAVEVVGLGAAGARDSRTAGADDG